MVGLCNEPSPDFQRLAEPRFLFGLGKDFAEPRFLGLAEREANLFLAPSVRLKKNKTVIGSAGIGS